MLLIFSAALVLFALALVLTLQIRHGIPPDQGQMDNAVALALRLLPALEEGDEAQMIAALGGRAGLGEIRRTIRSIGAYAARIKSEHPDARKLMFASWWAFLFLGWSAWIETELRAHLPFAPVICTESLERHFCTMCATVDAIQCMYSYV